ncbi:MAG: F0F1 ATP synthase subunit A [Alphaproteobacteria bacterium]|nr:F0F1 ATP synthase subunit A [Alphaproteobacteria bacterium]PHX99311.1 MAG: F0F1 ATP synthase subunit A [Rhodospirillaceae bacterium]
MHQFELQRWIPLDVGGLDISYTNSALFMTLAVLATFSLFWVATRHRTMVPSRWQSVAELMYEFVGGMVKDNVGHAGMAYFPFIFTLFMFILFGNVLGLLPYSFTFTSHIVVNAVLALFIFVAVTIIGFSRHGLHYFSLFCPPGTPLPVAFVLVPIEIMSYFIRPVSLSLRLFANMLAGHVLLKVLAGFVISLGLGFGIVPFAAVFGVTLLEIMVAVIQAYVFALLSCIYLNDAINLH